MTKQELIQAIEKNESEVPEGILLINGATAHEFKAKWNELMEQHKESKIVWSKILWLYDCEYISKE